MSITAPLFALHAPDGFLEPEAAAVMAVASFVVVAFCLKRSNAELQDRQVPLAGMAAAFIFAAQTVNFPAGVGTSGHLIGATLAAVLLGPATGTVVLAVVVAVQALLFADGGLTALGYNVANMAIVPAIGGWVLFRLLRRFLPPSRRGVAVAAAIAAGLSVVLSAMALSLQWLFGASAPVAFDDFFTTMVGLHLLIGIGEGAITGMVLASILAARPDLVRGADGLTDEQSPARRFSDKAALGAGLAAIVVVAGLVSQFASSDPDGLEAGSAQIGIDLEAAPDPLGPSLFSDYATTGIEHEQLSLAIAAVSGSAIALLLGFGLIGAARSGKRSG